MKSGHPFLGQRRGLLQSFALPLQTKTFSGLLRRWRSDEGEPGMDDDELLGFGKHADKTAGWVYENDWSYVRWVYCKVEEPKCEGMENFAAYVEVREKSRMAGTPRRSESWNQSYMGGTADRARERVRPRCDSHSNNSDERGDEDEDRATKRTRFTRPCFLDSDASAEEEDDEDDDESDEDPWLESMECRVCGREGHGSTRGNDELHGMCLYCSGNEPDDRVQCNLCEKWFHSRCADRMERHDGLCVACDAGL